MVPSVFHALLHRLTLLQTPSVFTWTFHTSQLWVVSRFKNHVQNFVQVFTGQTWTNQMWQPITDQHEYDEKASVALEVDPTHN